MKPDQLVGSCLVVGVEGRQLDRLTLAALSEGRIAGIVLLSENIHSPAQMLSLTRSAEQAARKGGFPCPLICIDQEGGKVNRLGLLPNFPSQPAAATMAKLSASKIAEVSYAAGRYMHRLGINVDFAPDLDLDKGAGIIGSRSYGLDPNRVAECGRASIQGLQQAGVHTIVKHFPGHGLTHADSHDRLPRVKVVQAVLDKHESAFVQAMSAGPGGAMLAHILVQNVDSRYPASLSRGFAEHLRSILGPQRLIFTDSGSMDALAKYGSEANRAAIAISAGVDIYLTTTPYRLLGKKFNRRVYDHIASMRMLRDASDRVREWRLRDLQRGNGVELHPHR